MCLGQAHPPEPAQSSLREKVHPLRADKTNRFGTRVQASYGSGVEPPEGPVPSRAEGLSGFHKSVSPDL